MSPLQTQDQEYVWHPFSPLVGLPAPLPVVGAEGCYLHLEDGRTILDAISSWWVNLHGHNHPYITSALKQQLDSLHHVMFAGFTHEPAVRLAQRLLHFSGMEGGKVFYSDNGSTAIEVALKIVIQYWQNKQQDRPTLVALEGAYHGDTFGAMAMGERGVFTKPFKPYLFEVAYIKPPTHQAIDGQESLETFEKRCKTGKVGALLVEPLVQGSTGMRMYAEEWLEALFAIAKRHEVCCIADEIFTGFYRTGKPLATSKLNAKPDVICLSKGLTGGTLPLGATLVNEQIVETFQVESLEDSFLHGHSYTANPLACTAANASLDLLAQDQTLSQVKQWEKWNEDCVSHFEQHPAVKQARSLGTIFALELRSEKETGYENEARSRLYKYFMNRNILLRPLGNIIYSCPPYCAGWKEKELIKECVEECLDLETN